MFIIICNGDMVLCLRGIEMAFDISKITSAVNKYLYSISDVNKLLTDGNLSGADSSSNLSGIFEKYLTSAIENAAKTSGSADLTESEITSAILSLSNGTTIEKTGIDKISNKDNMSDEEVTRALTSLKSLSAGLSTDSSYSDSDSMFSSSLPDLTGLGALSNLTSLAGQSGLNSSNLLSLFSALENISESGDSASGKSVGQTRSSAQESSKTNTQSSAIAEQIAGTFTSLNLEAEIKGAFSGMDNLSEQIKSKIANRDITGEINKSIENLDIKGDIQRSIASHDRSDEINSYNATRLKNYKKQATGTSVFGEYRL